MLKYYILLILTVCTSLFGVEIIIDKTSYLDERQMQVREKKQEKKQEKKHAVHSSSKLMWQDDISVKKITRNWSGAKIYCQNLNLLGFDDWYLPSKSELLTLVDSTKSDPAIRDGFKNVTSSYYWSSTENTSEDAQAWYVYFYDGEPESYYKNDKNHVCCVRKNMAKEK